MLLVKANFSLFSYSVFLVLEINLWNWNWEKLEKYSTCLYTLQSLTIYRENENWCSEKIPMHLLSPAALCCVLKLQIIWKARLSWNCSRMKHFNISSFFQLCVKCVLCASDCSYVFVLVGFLNWHIFPITLYVRLLDAVLRCIYICVCVCLCV